MRLRNSPNPRAQRLERALRDDIGTLPVLAAIDRHENGSRAEEAKALFRVVRLVPNAKPQHVHRRAEILDGKAGPLAHRRMAPVAGNDERRPHFDLALGAVRPYAHDRTAFFDQVGPLRLQTEGGIAFSLLGEEIEEVPLRHEGDVRAMHRKVAEVADHHRFAADIRTDEAQFLMRQPKELGKKA